MNRHSKDKEKYKLRLKVRKAAYKELSTAYIAIANGQVKSYMIDDRQLTRLDLDVIKKQLDALEDEIDELEDILDGIKPRKAVGIIPRDW